ncbi:MAG: OmpA family protein [Bacteroidetes bacterium]|nr:OmpA family protein [Bacteroidota bacterium]
MKLIVFIRDLVFCATIACFVGAYSVCAQKSSHAPLYYLGVFGAFNWNSHAANFGELPGFTSCCPQFSSGSGTGFSAGFIAELPLTDYLRLQIRPAFSSIGGKLTTPEIIGNTRILNGNSPFDTITAPVTVEHSLDATLYTAGIEPTAALNITDGLFAHAGFSLAFLFNAQADVRETIISPETSVFLDGRAFRNDKTGAIDGASSMLFSGIFGLSYELPIGGGKFLRPDIRYFLPFSNLAGVSWKAHTLQIGAGLLFAVYPQEEIKYLRDTVYLRDTASRFTAGIDHERVSRIRSNMQVETIRNGNVELRRYTVSESYLREIPRKTVFSVAVSAAGIEKDGARQPQPTIRIEEIETEESFPLLPYVFYPENSGNLARTSMKLLDAQRARNFREDKLPGNTLDIYSQMLNIVGSRLRNKPNAKLIITGTSNVTGDDGKPETVAFRAAEIQQYFERVWNIEPSRISRKTRGLPEKPANNSSDDGREENRRAELASDDADILRPITLRTTERKATPPRIEITPSVQSDTGIVYWSIVAEQSGEKLREYNGSSMPGIQSWNLEIAPQPKFETPVNVSLIARNERGEEQSARTAMEVRQLTLRKKRYELKNDMRIERFSLIVFDFNSAELSSANRKILEDIKSRITPESRIAIAGYADRTGELAYNSDLARRRCIEAQNFLNLPDDRVEILPVGSRSLLYDNSSPQGRSYSRTVQISISTPIRE